MRALPELVTMAKGMFVACRAVLSALLMLVLLIYIFAIVMHSFLKENEKLSGYWSTISESMWTLLLTGVFLDGMEVTVRDLIALDEYVSLGVFILFVNVSTITVMNMLIGVLCEVVTSVANAEKENAARAEVRATILKMLRAIDNDGNGEISKDELLGLLIDPGAVAILNDLEVDIPHLLDVQDMIYETPDAVLSIAQIMNMILEFRGDRTTTMHDLIKGYTFIRWSMGVGFEEQTNTLKDHVEHLVGGLSQQVQSLTANQKNRLLDRPCINVFNGFVDQWKVHADGDAPPNAPLHSSNGTCTV